MNDAFDLAVSIFGVSATRSDNCLEPLGQERGTLPGHPTATSKRPPRIGRMHEQQSGEQADGRHWTAHNHAEMHGGGQVDAAFSDPVVLPATMRFYDRSRAALQRTPPGQERSVAAAAQFAAKQSSPLCADVRFLPFPEGAEFG